MNGEGGPAAGDPDAQTPGSSTYLNADNLQRLRSQASARQRKASSVEDAPGPSGVGSPPRHQPPPAPSRHPRLPSASESRGRSRNGGRGERDSGSGGDTAQRDDRGPRLANLIGYLDTVEEKQSRIEAELQGLAGSAVSGGSSAGGGRARSAARATHDGVDPAHAETAASVTKLIVQQQLELKEKDTAIAALERQLHEAQAAPPPTQRGAAGSPQQELSRSGGVGVSRATEAELEEANRTINRHLKFIDRLIGDKQALSQRCEQLVAQVKASDTATAAKVAELKEAHKLELKKRKEAAATAEKARREKWVAEQTKRIKDMTVKGLEPEIQRLMQEHKAEIERVRAAQPTTAADREAIVATHRAELAAQESAHKAALAAATAAATAAAEKEAEARAVAAEREFQTERRRLNDAQQAAQAEAEAAIARARDEAQQEYTAKRQAEEVASLSLKRDTERLLRESAKRHERELVSLKEQLAIEKESWEDMYMRKQTAQLKTKESEIREQLREERDKQINMVIDRLEKEMTQRIAESDEAYEGRVRRLRTQHQAQLADAEQAERACLAKYTECRQSLMAKTEEVASLRGVLHQRDQDLARAEAVSAKLTAERDRLTEVIRSEFAERLATQEAELERARLAVQTQKDAAYREVTELRREKDTELDRLHERVEAAIAKKDETIAVLREKAEAATRRADHLEELLETQRQHLGH